MEILQYNYKGEDGTGGLLIIYCNLLSNNGKITANGMKGGKHDGGGGSANIVLNYGLSGGSGGGISGKDGGSGYIGNRLLFNKHMTGYNVETSDDESTKTITTTNVSEEPMSDYAKKGNGYAKITCLE